MQRTLNRGSVLESTTVAVAIVVAAVEIKLHLLLHEQMTYLFQSHFDITIYILDAKMMKRCMNPSDWVNHDSNLPSNICVQIYFYYIISNNNIGYPTIFSLQK